MPNVNNLGFSNEYYVCVYSHRSTVIVCAFGKKERRALAGAGHSYFVHHSACPDVCFSIFT
jgi:hypothetical protein